jgi:sec-independent protein translocase protein TatC
MSSSESNSGNQRGEMSFLQHLEALRWHLVRSAAAIVILALVWFFMKELLFDGILLAPKDPNFITYRLLCDLSERLGMGEDLCVRAIPFTLIATDISSQFTTHMWLAFMAGLVTGFPYLVWELWRFVKPALHTKDVITPMTVNFLGTYQVSAQVQNMITLDSFISTVSTMTLITGLVFELPIVVYFLTKIGMLSASFMREYRRHAVVVIMIVAAVITPTSDATTLVMVALPLYVLYEISIFVSAYVNRHRKTD